jgi:hypothetical protein
MMELFLIKEDVHRQHWTSDGLRYNVGRLYDFARDVADIEDIPLSLLQYGFEHTNVDEEKWSDEFVERCMEANLDYPILVVVDKKGKHWIADGNHRYGKAVTQGLEMISGYIVHEDELPSDAIDPSPQDDDESEHEKKESSSDPIESDQA